MKLSFFLVIILLAHFNSSFAQWPDGTRRFDHNYARAIDNQDTLINGTILTFSHSTEYECIHMVDTSGTIHLIDLRGRTAPGYFILFEDRQNVVLFEVRGSGSGNPPMYLSVSKFNCGLSWLPDGKPK